MIAPGGYYVMIRRYRDEAAIVVTAAYFNGIEAATRRASEYRQAGAELGYPGDVWIVRPPTRRR